MNEIEIDITIKMGDTCENTMSLSEAKALYLSLHGLFNGGVSTPVQKVIPIPAVTKTVQATIPAPNLKVEAAKKTARKTSRCGSK